MNDMPDTQDRFDIVTVNRPWNTECTRGLAVNPLSLFQSIQMTKVQRFPTEAGDALPTSAWACGD